MSAELIDLTPVTRSTDVRYIYNPNPKLIEQDVGGCTIQFIPCDKDKGHGLGVTEIRGLTWYEKVRDGSLVVKADGKARMTAEEVLKFLLGDDSRSSDLARAGLRPLLGDPVKDEMIRKEAHEVSLNKRYIDARNAVRTHESANAKADAAGTERPIFTKAIQEAYRVKAEYERGELAASRPLPTKFCAVCNYGGYDEVEMQLHARDIHGTKTPLAGEPAADVAAANRVAELLSTAEKLVKVNEAQAARIEKLEEAINAPKRRGRPVGSKNKSKPAEA